MAGCICWQVAGLSHLRLLCPIWEEMAGGEGPLSSMGLQTPADSTTTAQKCVAAGSREDWRYTHSGFEFLYGGHEERGSAGVSAAGMSGSPACNE
jgi:hypothetical protein